MAVFAEHIAQGRSGLRVGYVRQGRTVRWVCLSSARLNLENTLIGSAVAGVAGPFIPRCQKVEWVEEVLPGLAFVSAHFESVPWPGEAYVTVHVQEHGERKRMPLSGLPVEEDYWEDGSHYITKITNGDRIIHVARFVAVIHTSVYANGSWGGWFAGVNCVASNSMSKLAQLTGLLAEGECWRLIAPHDALLTPMARGTDLIFHDYAFAYEKRGWNHLTEVTKYKEVVVKRPVMDAEGNPTDEFARTTELKDEEGPDVIDDYPEFDFSGLDAKIIL